MPNAYQRNKWIAEPFLARLVQAYASVKIGNPRDAGVLMGPLINERAVTTMLRAIESIKTQEGQLLCGGHRLDRPGYFVEPTIVRAPADMPIIREETFARQKALGVIPQDAQLTERHAEIPAWEDMPAEMRPVLARQMEVYAGFLEHVDHHVGRLVDALGDLEILDDTLVVYILGDNGASAEGTINGSFNEYFMFNGAVALETPEYVSARIDEFGTPSAYNHYAVGWAHAMGAPYQWTKQVASH